MARVMPQARHSLCNNKTDKHKDCPVSKKEAGKDSKTIGSAMSPPNLMYCRILSVSAKDDKRMNDPRETTKDAPE